MKKVDIVEIIFLLFFLFASDWIGSEKTIIMLLAMLVFRDAVVLKERVKDMRKKQND
jgi:hypothetical protein